MMINKRFATAALALTLAFSLSACSNMSKRDRNTAIGAGAVGGAVLTGSTLGTLGGAAIGGVIGQITLSFVLDVAGVFAAFTHPNHLLM